MPETSLVKYKSWEGADIALTMNDVLQFLVHGNAQYITQREVRFFLELCKSEGLNPFVGDAYLMKYTKDQDAAIITSIHYARNRARTQPDCQGWDCGCILEKADGTIIYSHGLQREGEKVLGGWFKATPRGWNVEYQHEVNLRMYIKRKADGTITRFWTEEKQAQMITKVAEFQGLKALWPKILKHLHEEDEVLDQDRAGTRAPAPGGQGGPGGKVVDIGTRGQGEEAFETIPTDFTMGSTELGDAMDFGPGETIPADAKPAQPQAPQPTTRGTEKVNTPTAFWKAAPKFINKEWIKEYVDQLAKQNGMAPETMMAVALTKWAEFEAGLRDFLKKKTDANKRPGPAQAPAPGKAEPPKAKPAGKAPANLIPPAPIPETKGRIGLQDAIENKDLFRRHPDQVKVLYEMRNQAGEPPISKDLGKFTDDERLGFWDFCHDIIEGMKKHAPKEIKCPNGDIMTEVYCKTNCRSHDCPGPQELGPND